MFRVTVRSTMLEKLGTLLKSRVSVEARPLGSPWGTFSLMVKLVLMTVCACVCATENNTTPAIIAGFNNFLYGVALIEKTIMHFSHVLAIIFYAKPKGDRYALFRVQCVFFPIFSKDEVDNFIATEGRICPHGDSH